MHAFFIYNLDISPDQFPQPRIVRTLADGIEFPFSAMTVNLSKNHGCHTGIILTQIVFTHLRIICRIHQTDKGIFNQAEMLAFLHCLINGNNNDNLVILIGHTGKIYDNLFVIPFSGSCQIISHMLHRTGHML